MIIIVIQDLVFHPVKHIALEIIRGGATFFSFPVNPAQCFSQRIKSLKNSGYNHNQLSFNLFYNNSNGKNKLWYY